MMTYKKGFGRMEEHTCDIPEDTGVLKSKKLFQYNNKLDGHRLYFTHSRTEVWYADHHMEFGTNKTAYEGIGNHDYLLNRRSSGFCSTWMNWRSYQSFNDDDEVEHIDIRELFDL